MPDIVDGDVIGVSDNTALGLEAGRSLADAALASDTVSAGFDIKCSLTDTEAVADSLASELEAERGSTDAEVTTDAVALELNAERSISDITLVADTVSSGFDIRSSIADTEAATDNVAPGLDAGRSSSDGALTTDQAKSALSAGRKASDSISVTDRAFGIDTHGGSVSDTVSVSDQAQRDLALGGISGRRVYLRHLVNITNGKPIAPGRFVFASIPTLGTTQVAPVVDYTPQFTSPTYVVSHKDDAGYFVRHLRQGQETPVLASMFEEMRREREEIATMMEKNLIAVNEDYLGGVRSLLSGQVASYVAGDQPWALWVAHRSKTGAPVVVDASGPTAGMLGTFCQNFTRILVNVKLTGGTIPTIGLTPWFRSVTALERGPWTFGSEEAGLVDSQEYTLQTDSRELYLQITSISGNPTSVDIALSGTA